MTTLKLMTILLIFTLHSAKVSADTLKPFVSDGCSSFPNGTFEQQELWLSCCHKHDFDYWQGGTYQQRLNSDLELKACVAIIGEPEIALLMLAGVRVGGTPYLPTKFRWGYGWSYPRFYGELTAQELLQVKNLSSKMIPAVNKVQ